MEFEVLKRSHLKRNVIIGVVAVFIISAAILNFTRAKYRSVATTPLIHSTINYSLADLNIVAITVDGEEVNTIPTGNYELTEESYCEVNGVRDDSVELTYDSNTQTLNVVPFTTKGTKCYLYFDEQLSAVDFILAGKSIDTSRSGAITGTLTTDTTGTVYSVADDWGTSYVYAGAPTDNWVSFAGYYWRIIRINGDGSIRLIYNGTSTSTAGINSTIQSDTFYVNAYAYDNAYVGYMYGTAGSSTYAATHANINDSGVKIILDEWYQENLLNYSGYMSTEAGFCNDRKTVGGVYSIYGTLGYSTYATAYSPLGRLYQYGWLSSQNPSLKCNQIKNDLFTTIESSKGNHALTFPIGLITVDEVVLAGGFGGSVNENYYLYSGYHYWTMSPYYFYENNSAEVFLVLSSGNVGNGYVGFSYGIRPVINLRSDVNLTGTGTSTDPYVVVT